MTFKGVHERGQGNVASRTDACLESPVLNAVLSVGFAKHDEQNIPCAHPDATPGYPGFVSKVMVDLVFTAIWQHA